MQNIALMHNIAKRVMKISGPIFPIEMDIAKRGIFSSTSSELFFRYKSVYND